MDSTLHATAYIDLARDDQRMSAEQTVHDIVTLVADATNTAAPPLYTPR